MIIDELQSEQDQGRAVTSARLRWACGEFRLEVKMPAEVASGRADASPFLCASILLAMRLGEHVDVQAPVSGPLLERVPRIVDLYSSWDRSLFRSRIRVGAQLEAAPRASGIACFLSRGVDSLYSAASPRGSRRPLTHLVFCDRLEPIHSDGVRAEEVRLAGEAAARLGLPLVVIESNIRQLTDPVVRNWEDIAGAGLSCLAISMSGGFNRVVIPSSDGPRTIGPSGTSPLLDPLFSTTEVEVEHDVPQTRTAKVAWLAHQRPDLLPYLKVCFYEDRSDNCGCCSKCLLTMLALEAAGVRARATAFPAEIDREVLAELRIGRGQPQEDFRDVERALRAKGGSDDLADLIGTALERAAARPVNVRLRPDSPSFRMRAARDRLLKARKPVGAPRTTVMMPSYEAERTLRGAVDSVLSQTFGDLELVVVDDGSTVPVAEVLADVSDSRLRIIRGPQHRLEGGARATGLPARCRRPVGARLPRVGPSALRGPSSRARLHQLHDPRPPDRSRGLHRGRLSAPDGRVPKDRRAEPGPMSHRHDADGRGARSRRLRAVAPAVRGLPPLHEARAGGLAFRLRPRAAGELPLAAAEPRYEL
jgi:Glycosyl transferase family 2